MQQTWRKQGKVEGEEGTSSPSTFSLLPPILSAVYYVGSCDYTQVEKSLASETRYALAVISLLSITTSPQIPTPKSRHSHWFLEQQCGLEEPDLRVSSQWHIGGRTGNRGNKSIAC